MKSFWKSSVLVWVFTAVLMIGSLSLGHFFAVHKPLENDELFTHVSSVEGLSYQSILKIKIPEGNVSPLFYLTQKIFLDAIHFRLPFVWNGDWFVTDLPSQKALRCLSNFFISLSITVVFYYFTRFYSLIAGLLSVLFSLTSFMVLMYWPVARPYALWNFLTTAQTLLFFYVLRCVDGDKEKTAWTLLVVTHFLLALTVTFSAAQIIAVSVFLFFLKERDIRKFVLLTVLPVTLCLVYYFNAPHYSFYFTDTPLQLIAASFPKERLVLVLLLGGLMAFPIFFRGKKGFLEKCREPHIVSVFFTIVMLFLTMVLLGLFYVKAHGQKEGFPLSNRYFIYLSPVGIIAMTFVVIEGWKFCQAYVWRAALVFIVGGLLLFRLHWAWQLARAIYGF